MQPRPWSEGMWKIFETSGPCHEPRAGLRSGVSSANGCTSLTRSYLVFQFDQGTPSPLAVLQKGVLVITLLFSVAMAQYHPEVLPQDREVVATVRFRPAFFEKLKAHTEQTHIHGKPFYPPAWIVFWKGQYSCGGTMRKDFLPIPKGRTAVRLSVWELEDPVDHTELLRRENFPEDQEVAIVARRGTYEGIRSLSYRIDHPKVAFELLRKFKAQKPVANELVESEMRIDCSYKGMPCSLAEILEHLGDNVELVSLKPEYLFKGYTEPERRDGFGRDLKDGSGKLFGR